MSRAEQVMHLVVAMLEASDGARSWTQPADCGRDDPRHERRGGCKHADCIERAGSHAKEFTQEAVRYARDIEAML